MCHSEATAAYMADGYARASGKPGICMAQVIGALNLAAGLRDAWLAHSPVIAFTGGREPKTKFRKVYQEVDDVPAFEPVTKLNATVDDVTRFPDMVRQAFRVATTGRPGPVHLQFRGNEGQVDGEEGEMEPLVEPEFAHVPPFRPEPDAGERAGGAEVLQKARAAGDRRRRRRARLGRGARARRARRGAANPGRDLAQRQGFDPGQSSAVVGVVGTYSRESANQVVNAADLVCFIGTETGGMTTHFWAVPKIGTPAIQIDIDPEALGRNYPLQARVNGDAKVTLPHAGSSPTRPAPASARPGSSRRSASQGVVRQVQAVAGVGRGADQSGAHLPRAVRSMCRTTPSSWSTPAMPACGWAACTTCASRRRAISAAPAISAGHFRAGIGAKCGAVRTGRW